MYSIIPYQTDVDIFDINGRYLRQALEHSASMLSEDGSNPEDDGGFLQVRYNQFDVAISSLYHWTFQISKEMKITIDLRKPIGSRITTFMVQCQTCPDQSFEDIQEDAVYSVTCPSFISNGGDGHTILASQKMNYRNGALDTDVFQAYLKTRIPVNQDIENRITIVTESTNHATGNSNALKNTLNILLHLQSIHFLVDFIF